jgi:integrase
MEPSVYNARHTYATVSLMDGVNPAEMAEQLGYGTVVFSKDYARWISSMQDMSEMEKIEGKLGSASSALLPR